MMRFKNIRGHWIYYPSVNSSSNIVDLGANLGEFSKSMNQLFKSRCYAVEPNKILFDSLSEEISSKLNAAITTKDEMVKFYVSSNSESSSLIENFETQWGKNEEVIVTGYSWKTLIRKLNLSSSNINVLKIDVEAAELDLIESFDQNDIAAIEQITIEFHDWLNPYLHSRTVGAIEKLTSYGFLCFTDAPNHKWPVEALFVRKKSLRFSFFEKVVYKAFLKVRFLKY